MKEEAEEHFGTERSSSFGLPWWFLNHTFDTAEIKTFFVFHYIWRSKLYDDIKEVFPKEQLVHCKSLALYWLMQLLALNPGFVAMKVLNLSSNHKDLDSCPVLCCCLASC